MIRSIGRSGPPFLFHMAYSLIRYILPRQASPLLPLRPSHFLLRSCEPKTWLSCCVTRTCICIHMRPDIYHILKPDIYHISHAHCVRAAGVQCRCVAGARPCCAGRTKVVRRGISSRVLAPMYLGVCTCMVSRRWAVEAAGAMRAAAGQGCVAGTCLLIRPIVFVVPVAHVHAERSPPKKSSSTESTGPL